MEEVKEAKKVLEELGLYFGPERVEELEWTIERTSGIKQATKGVPASAARTLSHSDFLNTFATNQPKSLPFSAIRRHVTIKEVVTQEQTRVALNNVSFKVTSTFLTPNCYFFFLFLGVPDLPIKYAIPVLVIFFFFYI